MIVGFSHNDFIDFLFRQASKRIRLGAMSSRIT